MLHSALQTTRNAENEHTLEQRSCYSRRDRCYTELVSARHGIVRLRHYLAVQDMFPWPETGCNHGGPDNGVDQYLSAMLSLGLVSLDNTVIMSPVSIQPLHVMH